MTVRQNSVEFTGLTDSLTPVGERLTGKYKRSFAYSTIKDRLPVILTRVIDSLSRDKEEIIQKYGQAASEDLKRVIGKVSKLKNEIVTNKCLLSLVCPPDASAEDVADVESWNDYLDARTRIEGQIPTWFETIWLYCECYMYRRLREAFVLTETLKTFDPFLKQKQEGFNGSIDSITALGRYTLTQLNKTNVSTTELELELYKFLKLSLWGNRCDLSLSGGAESGQVGDPVKLITSLDVDILADDSKLIWNILEKSRSSSTTVTLDIVLDNAGYEFFTDLCLASFLLAHKFAGKVRFYVKRLPWYVSDVTRQDFDWTIERLERSSVPELAALGKSLKDYANKDMILVQEESYWTLPFDFAEMSERDSDLYGKLSEAKVVVFKGDLNYRKLVGDINWEYSDSFSKATRNFKPTNMLSLRTIKADVCAGLAKGQGEALQKKDPSWMITGQYGLIEAAIL